MPKFYKIIYFLSILLIASCSDSYNNPRHTGDTCKTDHPAIDSTEIKKHIADSIEKAEKEFDLMIDTLTPVKLPKKDEKMLRATMRLAHTTALRRAIDMYLKKQEINDNLEEESFDEAGIQKALDLNNSGEAYSFPKLYKEGYLSGKFILLAVNDNIAGGVNLDVIFKQKQDKVLTFWMYYLDSEDRFVVRNVYTLNKYDEKQMKFYRRLYSLYLNDDNFGV